jgi:sec-independent protein translocase protein TatA
MGSLGVGEIAGIVVVLVLLFGARKLPELGSSVGQSIKNFKRGIADAADDDEHGDRSDAAAVATDESAERSPTPSDRA